MKAAIFIATAILAILLFLASAFVSQRAFSSSVLLAYREAAQGIGAAKVRADYVALTHKIPAALLVRRDNTRRRYRHSVGGYASDLSQAVLHGQSNLKARFLRWTLEAILLLPLRLMAIVPYLIGVALVLAYTITRYRMVRTESRYLLRIDTSGSLRPIENFDGWRTLLAAPVLLLLVAPLPIPVWVPATLIMLAILVPAIRLKTTNYPTAA